MPDDNNQKEQLQNEYMLLQYTQKKFDLESKLGSVRKSNVGATLKALKDEEDLIQKLIDKGELSVRQGAKELTLNKARQKEYSEYAKGSLSKVYQSLTTFNLNAQQLLGKTAVGAIALLLLAQVDAQRKLSTLVGSAAGLYGKLGSDGGQLFGETYTKALTPYMAYITDEIRGPFLKSLLDLGVPLRGLAGDDFKILSDQLLVLGGAFNIASSTMAETMFQFQDIFQKSTADAGLDIEKLANTSLALQVAPARLISLVSNLTSTFKLQKIGIQDITSVFVSYRKNAQLGVEAATELTQKTIGALAGLDESKIAGLLALTSGKGGAALGSSLVDFFKIGGQSVSSRLDLALNAFKNLETKFPAVMSNEFARTRMIMQTFGVQDFSTGVQLLKAVESTSASGGTTADAVKEAAKIMQGTTGSVQMINNILQNLMGRMFALVIPALTGLITWLGKTSGAVANFFGMSGESDAITNQRLFIMNQRAATMTKLMDDLHKGDQVAADKDQKFLNALDDGEAALSGGFALAKKSDQTMTTSMGLFDTMSDHLHNIKSNTLSTALSSKAIAASQEQMTVPVGTAGVSMMTPTAMKAYVESKIAASKVPLDVKVTVSDTTGLFKAVQTFSGAVK